MDTSFSVVKMDGVDHVINVNLGTIIDYELRTKEQFFSTIIKAFNSESNSVIDLIYKTFKSIDNFILFLFLSVEDKKEMKLEEFKSKIDMNNVLPLMERLMDSIIKCFPENNKEDKSDPTT